MDQAEPSRFSLSVPGRWLLVIAVAALFIGWVLGTPHGLLGKADAIGYAVCHRIDLRSFHLGNRQLPLCARCTGMYLGAMLGLLYQAALGRKRSGMPHWSVWVALGVMVAVFAVDGLNSYLHLFPGAPGIYEPQNWLRLLTGTGMGLVIACALFPAFNQTVWQHADRAPAMPSLLHLAVLVILALGLDWIVLAENPLVLYPLALISAAGVLVLLTMVYSMVWLMILRQEARIQHFSQLAWLLLGGLGMALLQIVILDMLRYAFTGTWDGFHLG
jgi:uncharacterized membrane protein